jgi:hypothetical protein
MSTNSSARFPHAPYESSPRPKIGATGMSGKAVVYCFAFSSSFWEAASDAIFFSSWAELKLNTLT